MNLVINSQFRPFTYDEMVKPLAQYKEAYDKVEQDYSDLATQTEMWKDIVNQTNSPEAYKMYQRYANDLATITEDFSKGMNLSNRRALLGMKRRYAQDISPIARADAAMKEANELRVKAGPDAIFEIGEYNSLDNFLHGKTANNNYTSRDALTKKTAAMTEAAMAEALRDPEFQKEMGDQFWLITQHTGGSYEDLMAAIGNSPEAQSRFAQIKQRVMADAGVDRYDARGRAAIEDAINTGLYAGLDKPVRSFQANQDHITPAQRHSMNMQSSQLALSAATSGMTWDKKSRSWVYDPSKDPAINRAIAKSGTKGTSGGSGKSRETVSQRPFFIDIKNPHKSHVIDTQGVSDISGTKLNENNFDAGMNNATWDDLTIEKSNDKLSTLILRYSGEDTLADAFRKYDIYIDNDGNLRIDPRKVNTYDEASTVSTSQGYDPNALPD